MSAELPAQISVESGPDGSTIYQLPVRDFGKWIWISVIPIVFSLGAIGFMIFWAWGFVGGMMQVFGPWGALAGLFTLPFLFGITTLLGVTLLAFAGRTRLIVRDHDVATVEQVGWFRRTRRIKREDIARLRVLSGVPAKASDAPQAIVGLSHLGALSAERTTGKPMLLVIGYPRDWLIPLANELSRLIAVDAATRDTPSRPIPVDVVNTSDQSGEFERNEQPANSLIDLQPLGEGFVFTVPAPGVWKGSSGLFTFGLFWCGFMTVFTLIAVTVGLDKQPNDPLAKWMFPLFIILFWMIGIGLLLGAINMGRRQAAIAVTTEQLKLIISGLFGTTRKEWALSELQTFRKGPSGIEVNDVPVMQLHIVPQSGSPYGLLTGRDEAEIEWIATHLRRALRSEAPIDVTEEAISD